MLKDRILMMLEADDGLSIGGVEEPEAAELAEEDVAGAEDQEFAEPDDGDDGRTSADSAFAEMRRQNEEYQRRIEELERTNAEYDEALGYFFEGDEKTLQAQAIAQERTLEDVRAEKESMMELQQLRDENEELHDMLTNAEVERMMASDLRDIQAIDPSVRSLADLGEMYFNLIASGQVSGVDAYYAVKAKESANSATTPPPVGRVSEAGDKSENFTKEEVEAMSPAEVSKHYDAIRRSMSKW